MIEVISVKFKDFGKVYYFDPNGLTVTAEDSVIVETARGLEYGKVVRPNSMVPEEDLVPPLKPVIRIATEEDAKQLAENKENEKKACGIAEAKVKKHGLGMNVLEVEYTFDRSKVLFYFSADGRVDFRELVKDLAGVFRTRIELRQIGVRDEAKMLKCFGPCGRQCCCSTFLCEFKPVSIKMAKDQNLSLNPTKISGACGRLMCCLNYEQASYEDMWKDTPRHGSIVKLPGGGEGTVIDVNVITGMIRAVSSDTEAIGTYHKKDVKIIRQAVVRDDNDSQEIKELTKE